MGCVVSYGIAFLSTLFTGHGCELGVNELL